MINNGTGYIKQKYHVTNFQCLCVMTRLWAGLYSVQKIFSKMSRLAVGCTWPCIHWVLATVSLGVQ